MNTTHPLAEKTENLVELEDLAVSSESDNTQANAVKNLLRMP